MTNTKSINQVAQENGDTSVREAQRIRERESEVRTAWRTVAFNDNEAACTAARIAEMTGYPVDFVEFVCGNVGYKLS